MFGLGGDKKKEEAFVFDLEKEVKDVAKHREIVDIVERRTQHIKGTLRKGLSKEDYGQLGTLLHGYASLLKVVGRINKK